MVNRVAIAALAALIPAAPALAQQGHAHGGRDMAMVPGEAQVAWQPGPPSLPKGVEVAALSGDPAKPGAFVLRVRVPAGTLIAPHTHAQDETLTILSGSIHHDMGPTVDRARGKALVAGGFVFLPADMPHSLWTTDGPVTLQVNGTGPFGLTYLDPADDPAKSR